MIKFICLLFGIECYGIWQMLTNKITPLDAFWYIAGAVMALVVVLSVRVLVGIAMFFEGANNANK